MDEHNDIRREYYSLNLFTGKKCRIHRHLFALFVIGVIFYNTNDNPLYKEPFITYLKIVDCIFLIGVSYINMYWLVPKFLLKNNLPKYLFGILVFIIISIVFLSVAKEVLLNLEEAKIGKRIFAPKMISFIFIGLIFIAASTAIKLFQRWILDSERINELVKVNMQSELEQLKNQINPHFLFNMLNNANVLIQKDPVKASQVLMTLSDLLRYQLYDSSRDKVLLTSDIHFLNDFLNLEKIRRDNFECTVSKEGQISGIQVPPFLFITFVENAIKHSLDMSKSSFVGIYFDVQHDRLNFVCINSKPEKGSPKNATGGLGLVNVRRRLELLFPNRHMLKITQNDDLYEVTLDLQL